MPRALWWPYGGVLFLMREVPLYKRDFLNKLKWKTFMTLQGYLAQKKQPPPPGPPLGPRHGRTVGSYGEAFSYERGTPVR